MELPCDESNVTGSDMIIENNQSETKRVGCYNHIEVLVQNLNQFSTKKKDDFGGFKDIGWIKDSTQDENKVVHAGVRFWIATRRCSSHSPYLSPLDFSHSLLELAIFPSFRYQVHGGFHVVAKIIREVKSNMIPYKFKCSHWW